MLDEVSIPIDFGGGLDLKTDPKLVVPGKMLRLQDAVFTNPKRFKKRNGYTKLTSNISGGGTLTSPKMDFAFKDQLCCESQGKIYSFSETQNVWVNKGNYNSVDLTQSVISSISGADGYIDCAVLNNYALYAWYGTDLAVYASVVDLTTGVTLSGASNFGLSSTTSGGNPVRCVVLAGTTLAVVYKNTAGSALVMRTVSFGGSGGVTFSSEFTITSGYGTSVGEGFGIAQTTTGCAIAYINGAVTGIKIATVNTSGTVTGTATIADTSAIAQFYLSQNTSTNDLWVYWRSIAGGTECIRYAVFNSSLTPILANTVLKNFGSLASQNYVTNMMSVPVDANTQRLYFGNYVYQNSVMVIDRTDYIDAPISGSPAISSIFSFGIMPFTSYFTRTVSGATYQYAIFLYRGTNTDTDPSGSPIDVYPQPTFFMIKLSDPIGTGVPTVVARFASGIANSPIIQAGNNYGYVTNVPSIDSNKVLFSCALEVQKFLNTDSAGNLGGELAIDFNYSYIFDFASDRINRAIDCSQLAVLNGSLLQAYDGQSTTELGFHLYPEIQLTQQTVAGGNIANGVYSYLAIYEWNDAQGNLHRSAPSVAKQITTTGANNSVRIIVTNAFLSQKPKVSISIYRTTNAGDIYFLVTDPVDLEICDFATSADVAFSDTLADSALASRPQAYTYPASSVLENSTPPPSLVTLAHNNRLWLTDAENPNTVWYTKSFQNLIGISPSAFLTQQIDNKFGKIASLAEIDEKIIYLKENGVCFQSGDGANDTGQGSSLSFPAFIPSDVGCSLLKSVVSFPGGVLFKSNNGIYALDRSLVCSYIGMDVEGYNTQNVSDARIIKGVSQIRFLTSTVSGVALVYDYIFNKWSTFTNHVGLSATIWDDVYVYVRSDGFIYKENSSSFLDDTTSFYLLAQTSWLNLGGVQGFQRVKRLEMLGDYANGSTSGHGLQISAAYDFSSTFSTPIPFTFLSSSGVFQYRERLPQQKCETISLLIQEVTTGDSADYIDLSNISFEAGVKKGLNKMGVNQSVG